MSSGLQKVRDWTVFRTRNKELDIVEGLAPSETEEEPTISVSVR
jgi:hypothetical protein